MSVATASSGARLSARPPQSGRVAITANTRRRVAIDSAGRALLVKCLIGNFSNRHLPFRGGGEREVQGRRGVGAPQRQSFGCVSGEFVGERQGPIRFQQRDTAGAVGIVEQAGVRGDVRRARIAIYVTGCPFDVNSLIGNLSNPLLPVRGGVEREAQGGRGTGALQRQSVRCVEPASSSASVRARIRFQKGDTAGAVDIVEQAGVGRFRRRRIAIDRARRRFGLNSLIGNASKPLLPIRLGVEREIQGRRRAGALQRQSFGRVSGKFVGERQRPICFQQRDTAGAASIVEQAGVRGKVRSRTHRDRLGWAPALPQ